MSLFGKFQTAKRHPLLMAGLIFMLYSMIVSATIQLLVLPYVLPGVHAGHGLLAGGDFPGLHEVAVRMASRILHEGWSAWELLPDGQSAAGLASAFYALTYPEPWSLIPINAVLHALAGVVVMKLVHMLSNDTTIAFFSAFLGVAFPSSFQWVSQIQKDSWYFAGMLLFLFGLVSMLRYTLRDSERSSFFFGIGLVILGALLASMARIYALQFIWFVGMLTAIAVIPSLVSAAVARRFSVSHSIIVFPVILLIFIVAKSGPNDSRVAYEMPRDLAPIAGGVTAHPEPQKGRGNPPATPPNLAQSTAATIWEKSDFLPEAVDRQFFRLSTARLGWIGQSYVSAGSMLDSEVRFSSAKQMLLYLPRAAQIGFLAPFPAHWTAEGVSPGASTMRRIVGLEMIILYPLLLIGLPIGAWRWKQRGEFWATAVFCTSFILIYSYAIPNLGTLYRMRYGFLMALAGLGFAALCLTLRDQRSPRQRRPS